MGLQAQSHISYYINNSILELRTSLNESLTSLISGVLAEILDEAGSQILSLLLPLRCVSISVARIKDSGIHVGQSCGNLEVEVRNLLGLSLQDAAIEDSVDDTTGIGDGDTLAGTVPTSVDEVSLGTALLHLLHEFLSILCGVQLEECLTEASRECRSGLSNTTLCTSQLSCETREEVVLGLLWSQDRYGRQYFLR